MSGINRAQILGRLGQDPDLRYTQSGDLITTLSVATSLQWKDKHTGEAKEKTEWHRAVCFGRTAEIAQQYLAKGRQVYLEGRLQTRKWQAQDGSDRYTTEIIVENLQLLGSRQDGQANGNGQAQANGQGQVPYTTAGPGAGPGNASAPRPPASPPPGPAPAAPAGRYQAASDFQAPPPPDFNDDIPF